MPFISAVTSILQELLLCQLHLTQRRYNNHLLSITTLASRMICSLNLLSASPVIGRLFVYVCVYVRMSTAARRWLARVTARLVHVSCVDRGAVIMEDVVYYLEPINADRSTLSSPHLFFAANNLRAPNTSCGTYDIYKSKYRVGQIK